jgi:Arc/MetJ-type ribon-helix-helix transcriptional regulator
MKRKISITIEESIDDIVERELQDGIFRNKSHLIEVAIRKLMGGKKTEPCL